MSRKKKILIGAGIVVVLGGVAFANFKFKRTEGITVNAEAVKKRKLEAIVSASGKIQPKRFVNISADTSGRVTELAVEEGDQVTAGKLDAEVLRPHLAEVVGADVADARVFEEGSDDFRGLILGAVVDDEQFAELERLSTGSDQFGHCTVQTARRGRLTSSRSSGERRPSERRRAAAPVPEAAA